jgi:hypothetical protein
VAPKKRSRWGIEGEREGKVECVERERMPLLLCLNGLDGEGPATGRVRGAMVVGAFGFWGPLQTGLGGWGRGELWRRQHERWHFGNMATTRRHGDRGGHSHGAHTA